MLYFVSRFIALKMVSPYCALFLLSCLAVVLAEETKEIPSAEPEYLDMLLESGQYEKFAELMGIEDVDLVRPSVGDANKNPMFNKGLHQGDMLLGPPEVEQARQGIRFEKYPGSKWPNGVVHYAISTSYSSSEKNIIEKGVSRWNSDVECLKFKPRKDEKDYIFFSDGNGCYSYFGKRNGQQSITLQKNWCVQEPIIIHEMGHAVGFAHEQNRSDRDDYVEILWNNIPQKWKSEYEKTNPNDFGLQGGYDYYSIMHYPVPAPETNNKPAFRVKKNGIDEKQIGNGKALTELDKKKIAQQYCPKSG